MIIIEDKTVVNTLKFPKNTDGIPSTLKLYSELTHSLDEFEVADLGTSPTYFTFNLTLSGMADGEYVYTVLDSGSTTLSEGYLRIGDISRQETVYGYGETYTAYNPETGESDIVSPYLLADVTTQVTEDGSYEISTPDGYDGISKVDLTVNVSGGTQYSAGTNIDITDNVISVTGITSYSGITGNDVKNALGYTPAKDSDIADAVSSAFTSGKTYTDSAVSSAFASGKTYTDNQVDKVLSSAKTYTDSVLSDEYYTYDEVDKEIAKAVSSTKTYTDGAVSSAFTSGKTYTDSKISGMTSGYVKSSGATRISKYVLSGNSGDNSIEFSMGIDGIVNSVEDDDGNLLSRTTMDEDGIYIQGPVNIQGTVNNVPISQIISGVKNAVTSTTITTIVSLTQDAYDALSAKSDTTVYIIKG